MQISQIWKKALGSTGSEEMHVCEDANVVVSETIVPDTRGVFLDLSKVGFRDCAPEQRILDNDQNFFL